MAEGTFATPEKGIAGFKKRDFVDDPSLVFGEGQSPELPDGVRMYLRSQAVDLSTKKIVVNVYRLLDDGGLKNRRSWVGKFGNRIPEDGEIAERFGGGSFVWIGKWTKPDGTEAGIISEQIDVDYEEGERARAEYLRRTSPAAAGPSHSGQPSASPAPLDAMGILQIMQASEEKAIATIERVAKIFIGQKVETPAEVLKQAYQGAAEMMQSAAESNLRMVENQRKAADKMLTAPAKPAPDDDDDEIPGSDPVPVWMRGFMPVIEEYLEKLLGGGMVGGAVKTLILSNEQWNEIVTDPERWGQAVAAIERRFGADKARRALEILMPAEKSGRRAPAKKGRK